MQMPGNNKAKANQQQPGDGRVHDYLTKLSKSVLLLTLIMQYVANLLLGWKAYDPEAWLPMPPVSTFLAVTTMFVIVGYLWISRATYKGE